MIQILTYLLSVTCLFAQTQAKTITVNVGDGGLVFTPDSVTAAKGDMIQFNYIKGNHSVAQSVGFDKPCHPAPNGIFSGFLPAPANMSFVVTINDTNPIWYYCSQFSHCGVGAAMVGVINPPQNETIDTFISNAKADTAVENPVGIMGGVFIAATNSTSNATSSAGSSTTTSGSPTSSGTGTATGSAATTSKTSGAWAVDATAAGGVGGLVALFAALLL